MAGEGEGVVITSEKKLAKDGTRRGLSRKGTKNKATLLLEDMQRQVEDKFGVKNFDPVVMLALIGMEALQPVVIEEDGQKVVLPPDRALAVNAFGRAAPYVRSQLKAVELTGEDGGPIQVDVVDAKARLAKMVGVVLEDDEEEGDDDA